LRTERSVMFAPDELLLTLTNAQVKFIVIGGVAVGVHGFVRATKDLDIVPDPTPENLAQLARVLAQQPSPAVLLTTSSIPAPIGTSAAITRSSRSTSARKSISSCAWETTLSTTSKPRGRSVRTSSGQ